MSRMPRGLSGFAIWVVLGLALALVPLACSSSGNNDSGEPSDMTNSG